MAQIAVKLGFRWRWWAWPAFYVIAWSAYPILAFCDEEDVEVFVEREGGWIARHGIKATVVEDADYLVHLD